MTATARFHPHVLWSLPCPDARSQAKYAEVPTFVRMQRTHARGAGYISHVRGGVWTRRWGLLGDSEWRVRAGAASALGSLGEHAAAFAPKLAELLDDMNSDVRVAAASALGSLSEHAAYHDGAIRNYHAGIGGKQPLWLNFC